MIQRRERGRRKREGGVLLQIHMKRGRRRGEGEKIVHQRKKEGGEGGEMIVH